jgi:hypothetical protein
MKITERLFIALKNKGVLHEEVGALVNMSRQSVSYRLKNNSFKDHDIKYICDHFGINSTWVLTGEGEMLDQDNEMKDGSVTYKSKKKVEVLFHNMYENEQKLRKQIDQLHEEVRISTEKEREIRDKYEKLLEKMVGKL